MNIPSWFSIIKQWREHGMGEYGVTLPFLVGALAYEKGVEKVSLKDISNILSEMIENPVDGYAAEIRWCGDIDEPVISIKSLDALSETSIQDSFSRPNSDVMSMVFTQDLMSMFNLDCKTADECRTKLAIHAKEHVENGLFSKNYNSEKMRREFGSFSKNDIKYINAILANSV